MHPVRASVAARPSPYLGERGFYGLCGFSEDKNRSRKSEFNRRLKVKNLKGKGKKARIGDNSSRVHLKWRLFWLPGERSKLYAGEVQKHKICPTQFRQKKKGEDQKGLGYRYRAEGNYRERNF